MEQKFDINRVIERYGLGITEVQEALFPHNQYKKIALDRVLRGEAPLNVIQLTALAKLAGVFVSDLFTLGDWSEKTDAEGLTFIKGEYKARLTYQGLVLTVYKNDAVIYQALGLKLTSIEDFIQTINNIIN